MKSILLIVVGMSIFYAGKTQTPNLETSFHMIKIPSEKKATALAGQVDEKLKLYIEDIATNQQNAFRLNYFFYNHFQPLMWVAFKLKKEICIINFREFKQTYIGETEKNISELLDQASKKNWILFFDEADALFGKRTNVKDAHDKYANQEVSYLFKRLKDFDSDVIIRCRKKKNCNNSLLKDFTLISKRD